MRNDLGAISKAGRDRFRTFEFGAPAYPSPVSRSCVWEQPKTRHSISPPHGCLGLWHVCNRT